MMNVEKDAKDCTWGKYSKLLYFHNELFPRRISFPILMFQVSLLVSSLLKRMVPAFYKFVS